MNWHSRYKNLLRGLAKLDLAKNGGTFGNKEVAEIIGNTPDSVKSTTQPNKDFPRWAKLSIVIYESLIKKARKEEGNEVYALLGTVTDYYDKAEKTASEVVEKMARQILREHTELDKFVMAMGTYFFVDENDNNIDTFRSIVSGDLEKAFEPLNTFIGEWDDVLKITGEAMTFTADGIKVTEW